MVAARARIMIYAIIAELKLFFPCVILVGHSYVCDAYIIRHTRLIKRLKFKVLVLVHTSVDADAEEFEASQYTGRRHLAF